MAGLCSRPAPGPFAPSRGRELKLDLQGQGQILHHVRPLAGAGIEMDVPPVSPPPPPVRPLAGAGIEIEITGVPTGVFVRPLAGAGIEIFIAALAAASTVFAPSRGRELKLQGSSSGHYRYRRFAPSRGRELK